MAGLGRVPLPGPVQQSIKIMNMKTTSLPDLDRPRDGTPSRLCPSVLGRRMSKLNNHLNYLQIRPIPLQLISFTDKRPKKTSNPQSAIYHLASMTQVKKKAERLSKTVNITKNLMRNKFLKFYETFYWFSSFTVHLFVSKT